MKMLSLEPPNSKALFGTQKRSRMRIGFRSSDCTGLWTGSILHAEYVSACGKLASFGLQNDEGVIHETS